MTHTGIKLAYLYIIAAVALLLSCYSLAANWDIQIVKSNTGTIFGASIDMVLDINGVAHVVYFDEYTYGQLSLVYATNGQGLWSNVPVEQENLTPTALKAVIAIDANNVVYIVYPDSEENLIYRTKENGQWSSSAFYAQGAWFLPQDAEIGAGGGLSVLYSKMLYDANSSDTALVLQRPGGAEVIAEHGNFQSGSLAIDSLSNPHLCYYDALNDVLKYAVKDGNSWTIETVDANTGDVPSSVWNSACLALDGYDVPHISYLDFQSTVLKYAHRQSGGWAPQVVDNTAYIYRQNSIAVDSNDNVHICYKRVFNDRLFLKHAVGTASGGWQFVETITDFNLAGNPAYLSIACDNEDKPNICYSAPSLFKVEYAVPLVCSDPDKNCRVDFFDFSILAQHWYQTGCASDDYCGGADIDKSTIVDNNDLNLLAESWLYCSPPGCY